MKRKRAIIGGIGGIAAVAILAMSRSRPRVPRKPKRGRITGSTVDRAGTVLESPRALLRQARKIADKNITMEELTAARLIASEHSSGSREEMAAIVDAELNRAKAKGITLTKSLTSAGTYGKQGRQVQDRQETTREHSPRSDPATSARRSRSALR